MPVMKEHKITVPELALVAGTRAISGVGLGLLLAGKLTDTQRRAAGWALLLVGAVSTIPLAFEVLGNHHAGEAERVPQRADNTAAKPVPAHA
jgi:hypothetical protein